MENVRKCSTLTLGADWLAGRKRELKLEMLSSVARQNSYMARQRDDHAIKIHIKDISCLDHFRTKPNKDRLQFRVEGGIRRKGGKETRSKVSVLGSRRVLVCL